VAYRPNAGCGGNRRAVVIRNARGLIDALGILNFRNNLPEHRPLADHSTDSLIPFCLQVTNSLANPAA
jgi:hypothetical protein